MRGLLAGLIAATALSACAQTRQDSAPVVLPVAAAQAMPGALEPIHAVAFTADQAVFRVSSNGCTAKGDITPVITRIANDTLITLRRTHEDRCDAIVEDGVEIIWSFEELGLLPGEAVEINKPYQLTPGG